MSKRNERARIILYTGKGGVGKTSVSAATAVRCAELGYRTVVVSTDAAHSLADSFDLSLGPEPTPIAPNLWGQEIDLLYQMEKYWGKVQEYLTAIFAWRGMDELVAEETSVLPGMEELASLMQITYLNDLGEFDVIIVDCAPTGATLQLLAFPEMARWYLEKIFPIERKAMQLARPILKAVVDMPLPDDELFDTVAELIRQLDRMHGLLSDPDRTTARLVLNPEKMVIKEAQRAFTYLNLYGYATDLIICNRMIPGQVSDGYFSSWKEIQSRYHQMVEEAFSPLPILDVPLFDQEVVGLEMLRKMALAIFGDQDPAQVFYRGKTQQIIKKDQHYQLSLPLPLVDRSRIHLTKTAHDELVIRIGNWKRNLLLPRVLAGLEVAGARYEGDQLIVTFVSSDGQPPKVSDELLPSPVSEPSS
ncbi:MAG: TRC40/GET3/ArsA family transport-energizing ATPase [Anaerolineae bacterium]|nr:TRC40/GET3/ArsA family transport-energizing ATPase [Anaerolineae bacterium]MDW8098920.1 TRC40/GET3/ArsA family transport-energizing ATPase [Anaerolineae bacterium]